jgi:large subunit ribosomal protein L23
MSNIRCKNNKVTSYTDFFLKSISSNKAIGLETLNNSISFMVPKSVNKIFIKNAIKELLNMDVIKVNIMNCPYKNKNFKGRAYQTQEYKKAIVKFKQNVSEFNKKLWKILKEYNEE